MGKMKTDRNRLIVDLYNSRWSMAAIGRYFRISRQRVCEIVHRDTDHYRPYYNYFTDAAIFSGESSKSIASMVTVMRMFNLNSDKACINFIKNTILDKDNKEYYYKGEWVPRRNFECLENYFISRYSGMEDIT